MSSEIIPCHPDHLDYVWPIVVPWLERALVYGPDLFTTDAIREQIKVQNKILWLSIEEAEILGFCIVSLQDYPKARVCEIHWTGGATHKGKLWMKAMLEMLKAWSKHNGCSKLGGGGRRGWLEVFGFKEHGIMFEMEI